MCVILLAEFSLSWIFRIGTAAKSIPVGCSLAALHMLAGGRQPEC
ncbi:hypothetical protein A2U01_0092983, partial [Trifolium medium]|nr:hypothetical protein [Trifolium medium]